MKKVLLAFCLFLSLLSGCNKNDDPGCYYVNVKGESQYPYDNDVIVQFYIFPSGEYKTKSYSGKDVSYAQIQDDEIYSNLKGGKALTNGGVSIPYIYEKLYMPGTDPLKKINSFQIPSGKYYVMCYPVAVGLGVDHQYKAKEITVDGNISLQVKFEMNYDKYGYMDW